MPIHETHAKLPRVSSRPLSSLLVYPNSARTASSSSSPFFFSSFLESCLSVSFGAKEASGGFLTTGSVSTLPQHHHQLRQDLLPHFHFPGTQYW